MRPASSFLFIQLSNSRAPMEFWSRMYKIFTDLDAEWDLVFAKSHICGKMYKQDVRQRPVCVYR